MENLGLERGYLELCDYREDYPSVYEKAKEELLPSKMVLPTNDDCTLSVVISAPRPGVSPEWSITIPLTVLISGSSAM